MREIAVIERSRMDQATLAFQVRACNAQLQQLAEAFDEEPWFARSYAAVPDADVAVMLLLDTIDEPGALGYHDLANGKPYGRCRVTNEPSDATTLSHECLELARDPNIDLWLPMPDGRTIAYEVADPVQEDEYPITVTIGDETRTVWVSDFVVPAYFVQGSQRPFSYRDNVDEQFGVSRNGGGWRLVRNQSGDVTSEFGPLGASTQLVSAMTKRANDPGSRTHRRGYRGES